MTYPVTYELGEKAEVEYALKRKMAERLAAGFNSPGKNDSYVHTARALRKTMKTDGVEYFVPVHELTELQEEIL